MALSPAVQRILTQYGLQSLVSWATNAIIMGWSEDQLVMELYERPEFHNRFKGIKMLEANGMPPVSPDQYLEYENLARSIGRMWGMDITQDEIDNLIGNGVSPMEMEERFTIVGVAVHEEAPETRSELSRLYGITQGDMMRYWMNPKETLGRLQQQFRTGQIAGAALRSSYGQLTKDQAERLANAGLTPQQALGQFSDLVQMEELFEGLTMGQADITQASQVEWLAGDASIGAEVEKRAAERTAEFAGSSGYASGEEGFAVGEAK